MSTTNGKYRKSMASILRSHVALDDTWDEVTAGHIRCNWTPCTFVPIPEDEDDHWRETFAKHVVEQLAAEGYGDISAPRLPVLTAPAELVALPEESAILVDGRVRVKNNEGMWVGTGEECSAVTDTSFEVISGHAGVTVLAIGGVPV